MTCRRGDSPDSAAYAACQCPRPGLVQLSRLQAHHSCDLSLRPESRAGSSGSGMPPTEGLGGPGGVGNRVPQTDVTSTETICISSLTLTPRTAAASCRAPYCLGEVCARLHMRAHSLAGVRARHSRSLAAVHLRARSRTKPRGFCVACCRMHHVCAVTPARHRATPEVTVPGHQPLSRPVPDPTIPAMSSTWAWLSPPVSPLHT